MKTNRVGKFELDSDYIRKEPELMSKVFAAMEFIPVRAEFMFAGNKMRYLGYSCLFDDILDCQIPPHYEIQVDNSPNVFSVKAVRLD